MPITFIDHTFYFTAMSYLMSRLAAFIPIANARGFTPPFGKNPPLVWARARVGV